VILISKSKLRFLLAGREITTTLTKDKREWRKGRHYAVGVRHNRTICRVLLVKITETGDELELTIRLADVEAPRLLGRTGGYVTDPALALRDEPEAVDVRSQERFTAAATARDDALRRERLKELQRLPLEERVRRLQAARQRQRIDISREMRIIQQRLERAIDAI
jgi:hypothetical protein